LPDPSDGPPEEPPSIEYYAQAMADGISAYLPTWVVGCVHRIVMAWSGSVPPEVALAAEVAAELAQADVGHAITELLASDVDDQVTTPLALLRGAVVYPTEVLRQCGVPPVERDRFAEAAFPGDDYDLSPSSLADIDPALAELGIAWGAAKAFEHRRRHRS
jgi:hypothetical protein